MVLFVNIHLFNLIFKLCIRSLFLLFTRIVLRFCNCDGIACFMDRNFVIKDIADSEEY